MAPSSGNEKDCGGQRESSNQWRGRGDMENGKWKMENGKWLLGEREDESQNALHLHRNSIQLRRLEDPLARSVHRRAEQQRMTTYGSGFNDASFFGNQHLHLH